MMTSWSLNCSRMSSQMGVGGSSGSAAHVLTRCLPQCASLVAYHSCHASPADSSLAALKGPFPRSPGNAAAPLQASWSMHSPCSQTLLKSVPCCGACSSWVWRVEVRCSSRVESYRYAGVCLATRAAQRVNQARRAEYIRWTEAVCRLGEDQRKFAV
jgi:hypothetical protein